ncbi:MAG: response regulator, partial [Planctomycetaceae bacterium]|nr:response regulator [Planctomycetaceae bacterium]
MVTSQTCQRVVFHPTTPGVSPSSNLKSENATAEQCLVPSGDTSELTARALLIDDEPVNVRIARKYLTQAGFTRISECTDPLSAYDAIQDLNPDVLILDLIMPEVSGLDILKRLRADDRTRHLPVIVLTAATDRETRIQALSLGATDFLAKPVDPLELIPRVRNAFNLKRYQDHLHHYSLKLEEAVQQKTAELELSHREVLYCLARAAEFRDDDTGHHILRVGRYAAIIARAMGKDSGYVRMIEQAAQLHDVGKIGIPDHILQKPGRLTDEEFAQIQRHPSMGREILHRMGDQNREHVLEHSTIGGRILAAAQSPLLQMAYRIALTHHERWDGTGYPIGLVGEDIPLEGRITAVADVFDALSTRRVYKPAFPLDKCLAIISEG